MAFLKALNTMGVNQLNALPGSDTPHQVNVVVTEAKTGKPLQALSGSGC